MQLDRDWRISVTRAAVRMEEKGVRMRTGDRGTYNCLRVGNENRYA